MSDPIDRLHDFASSIEGELMPRTAADARRRGDTLRRRRHALVAAGSAAAVVAVAVPVLALAGGTDGAHEPVGPATGGSTPTALSSDNLLADGETESIDGSTSWAIQDTYAGDGQDAFHPCATQSLTGLGAGRVQNRDWTPDGAGDDKLLNQRWLRESVAEFPSAQAAQSAYDEIAAAMPDCAAFAATYPDYEPQTDATHDVPIAESGQGQYFAASYDDVQDPQGGGYTHVLQTGLVVSGDRIAVVTMSYAGQDYVPKPMEDMIPVAAERLVTGSGPASTTAPPNETAQPPSAEGVTTTIPDDIPIDLDLVDMGSDGDYQAPEHLQPSDFEPVTLCDTDVWPPSHVDALSAWATGPEYSDRRDLLTFGSVDEAVAAVQSVRDVLQGCARSLGQVVTTHPDDTGYDSVTFSTSCPAGGPPCLSLYQMTRVGNAVLLTAVYGEGSLADIPQQVPARTDITRNIATHLCVFTADGCSGGSGSGSTGGAGAAYLGPDGYGDLRLGMSVEDASATGAATFSDPPQGGCTGFALTGFPVRKGLTDGYLSAANGLEVLFARPGMRTPEGIGLGSSAQDVAAAYPEADASAALATVPVGDAEYVISLREGKVTELALAMRGQTCWD